MTVAVADLKKSYMLSLSTVGYCLSISINHRVTTCLPDCTNLDYSSHVGQTHSNPPDAANCLLLHRTLRKCVQPCAIGHTKKVGGVTNLKSKLKGDMSL